MPTRRRKNNAELSVPFFHDPAITIILEVKFGQETITPGTKIKLRGKARRGKQFTFMRLVHNATKDVEWIDCMADDSTGWVSVRPDQIIGLVHKRSRAKKINE